MAETIDDSAKQPDKRQGTGFTNLQNLMNANQNNRLGDAVGSGVQNQFNQAQNSLNSSQNQFNNDIGNAKSTYQNNQQQTQSVLGDVASGTNAAPTDAQTATFNNVLGGQYTGPTQLANQDTIQAQTANAQQLGQLGSSEGGKVELLKRFAGGPQYTAGQSKLDSVLLGQQGNDVLTGLRRNASNLGSQANQDIVGAQQQGQELQGQTKQLATDTLAGLQGQYTGLMGDTQTGTQGTIQQQEANINDQRAAALAQAQGQLKTGAVDPAFLKQLGLTPGMSTFGLDFSNLATADPTQGNLINSATQQQASQLLALSKLGGSYFDPSEAAQIAKYNNNTDVGTYGNAPAIQMTDAARAQMPALIQQAQDTINGQIDAAAQAHKNEIDWQRQINGQYSWNQDLLNNIHNNSPQWAASGQRATAAQQQQDAAQAEYNRRMGLTLSALAPGIEGNATQNKVGLGSI